MVIEVHATIPEIILWAALAGAIIGFAQGFFRAFGVDVGRWVRGRWRSR